MNYKLKVIKTEENPNYADQLEKYRNDSRGYFGASGPQPDQQIITNAMEVELTSDQFEAVKKAVIASFE